MRDSSHATLLYTRQLKRDVDVTTLRIITGRRRVSTFAALDCETPIQISDAQADLSFRWSHCAGSNNLNNAFGFSGGKKTRTKQRTFISETYFHNIRKVIICWHMMTL